MSLLIGYFSALVVSLLTIAWAVRILGKASPRALLSGETTAEGDPGSEHRPPRRSLWISGLSAVGALALVICGRFVRDHEMQALTFFGGGALLLTAALAGVWPGCVAAGMGASRDMGRWRWRRSGIRNAARHPVRSLLTAGLLASAAFLIVAVESFRRQPGQDYLDKHSGSGGFVLLGESDVPIYLDLNRTWQRAVQARGGRLRASEWRQGRGGSRGEVGRGPAQLPCGDGRCHVRSRSVCGPATTPAA